MQGKYWFYLALASIILAYWVGATQVGKVLGGQLYDLANLSFGRNKQGNYPDYPK